MTKIISPHNYSVCSCCFELCALKNIWKKFTSNEQSEVYVDMLQECFNISWPRDREKDTICEVCISRLRNAVFFKRQVLEAQAMLDDKDLEITPIKTESEDNYEHQMKTIELNKLSKQFIRRSRRKKYTDKNHVEYVVVDFVYAPARGHPALTRNGKFRSIDNATESRSKDNPTESRSKDNPTEFRSKDNPTELKSKDNSTESKSIGNPTESRSIHHLAKLRSNTFIKSGSIGNTGNTTMSIRQRDGEQVAKGRQSIYIKLRLNTCLLLEHSTLLPFKCKKGYIDCFYCNKQYVNFDEMKTHTIQNHKIINFETISKNILRPKAKVRVDASDITCKLCNLRFPTVKELIAHLAEQHDVKFNDTIQPEDCIIPYELGNGIFKCYHCKKEFTFFLTLSQHMNEHCTDYVCDICGRCFLSHERLKAHIAFHTAKTVKCQICAKLCPNIMSLRSHIRHHHKKVSYKCLLCDIKFENNVQRLEHFQLFHIRVPIDLNCKVCGKKFGSLGTLNSHMRGTHSKNAKEAKYACSNCDMKFISRHKLKNHNLVHSGVKKFECEVCHKKFARSFTIKEHLKIHYNDKRWSCRVCGQCFVQKCSVQKHIAVHHSEYDVDSTMVYKKCKD